MTEYIKLYKASLSASGNDYGVSGNITVDLTENTTQVIQTVVNLHAFFDRMTTSTSKKPEKRAYNRKKLSDKIVIKGHLTRTDTEDPVTIKNTILALQQSVGLCDVTWREEVFDGSDNPKKCAFISAKFIDNRKKPIALTSGTASGGSTTTLVDSGSGWTTDQWKGHYVVTIGGTGSGQIRQIISNTTDTLTIAASGTHTGSSEAAILTDSAANFPAEYVASGLTVKNTTDVSEATITSFTTTTITGTLSGGTDDDWDNGDSYTVNDWTTTDGTTTYIITSTKEEEIVYEFELQFMKAVTRS